MKFSSTLFFAFSKTKKKLLYKGVVIKYITVAIVSCLVTILFFMPQCANAQTLFWNTNGTSNTLTAANWGTSSAGPFTNIWVNGSNIRFTATSAITNVTNIPVGNITVDPGVTVTLTPAGTFNTGSAIRTVTIGAGGTLIWGTQNVSTAGTSGFIFNGPGTWNIGTQGNAYPGGFTLNSGIVITGGNSNFGNGTLTINGGSIQLSTSRTFTNPIIIGGDFIIGSGGSTSGTPTFSGTVALGSTAHALTEDLSSGNALTYSGIISNSGGGITFASTLANTTAGSTIAITNTANTYTGTTTITGGEVVLSADGSLGAVPGSVTANSIIIDGGRLTTASPGFTINSKRGIQIGATAGTSISIKSGSSVTIYNGVISDRPTFTGSWAKQGAGTMQLGGVSIYSGATAVNNGILQLTSGANRLPTGTTLSIGQTASANLGTFDLNGNNQIVAGLNSTSGTNATATKNTVTTSTGTSTLTIGGSGTYSYGDGSTTNSGIITGAVSLAINGGGIQTLGDINTFTGSISVTNNSQLLFSPTANETLASSQVTLGGGTLGTTGITAGKTLSFGILNLTAGTNTIALDNSKAQILSFTNLTGTGTVTITNWKGIGGVAGTAGQLLIGTSAALTAPQLAQIQFNDGTNNYAAMQLSTGEIVPVPQVFIVATSFNAGAFGNVSVGATPVLSYNVSGSYLPNNVVISISSASGYFLQSTGSSYNTTSITLIPSAGALAGTPINVQFAPTAAGAQAGTVAFNAGTYSGGGTVTVPTSLSLSGTGIGGSTITVTGSPLTGLNYTVGSGPSGEQSFTVNGINLTADLFITPPASGDYIISTTSGAESNTPIDIPFGSGTVNTTVYVKLVAGLSAGNYNSENIVASSTGATSQNGVVSGTVAPIIPSIGITGSPLTGFNYIVGSGPSGEQSFTINATNLTSNLIITPPVSGDYIISTISGAESNSVINIPFGSGTVNTTVYVKLVSGLSVGNYNTENIVTSSTGATSQNAVVSGSVIAQPTIVVTGGPLTGFTYIAGSGPSGEQSFTINATNLTSNLIITPPVSGDYIISTTSGAESNTPINIPFGSGTINTTVYIKLAAGLSAGNYNTENIVTSSTGATSQNAVVSGTVIAPPVITVTGSPLTGFTYNFGSGPSAQQSFTVNATNLTANLILTAPADYEISTTSGTGFASSLNLGSGPTVATTTIFVRLKAGLSIGNYNSENVVVTSTSATTQNAIVSGLVYSPFTPGNVVVYRVGTGSTVLTSASTAIFLDEYNPAGTLVQSITMPTAAGSGGNFPITASGTASSEGLLSLSADQRYILAPGYGAAPGVSGVASTTSASVNRVVARVDASTGINTTTALTDFSSGNNIRSVTSLDGDSIWLGGAGGTVSGVAYTTFGATTSTQISTSSTNIRQVNIFNRQLYATSGSGSFKTVSTAGTGLQTTAGQTMVVLPGVTNSTSPYAFYIANLPTGQVLYIPDDITGTGTIYKYSLVGGTWVAKGSILAGAVRGLTGTVSGSTVTLYAATGGSAAAGGGTIYKFTDATGYTGSISGTATTIATAVTNEAFRGIAFVPIASTISLAPVSNQSFCNDGSLRTVSFNASANTTLSWAVTSGSIPGLATSGNGNISFTPTDTGTATITAYAYYGDRNTTPITFTITVNPLPVITTDVAPLTQTACLGDVSSNLTVVTSGTVTYQWYSNTTNSIIGGTSVGSSNGGQTASFTPPSVAGTTYYYCVVTGTGSCSVNSSIASVTVNAGTWTGASDGNWNNPLNWCGGIPASNTNVVIPAGTVYPTISGTSFVNNITINNGASLTVSNGGTFHIHGTITNSGGTFDATAGTIEMSGSSAQSIGGSMFASSTINNLIDSNTNTTTGLSINNNDAVNITGQLGFDYPTSILTTNNAVTLVSNASGTASVGEIAEDINGNAQSKINGNVIVQRYFIEHRRWRLITAPVQAPGPTISSSWQEGGQSIAGSISNPNPGFGAHITGPTIGAFVQSTGYDQSPSNSASIAWLTGAASWYALPTTFVPVTSYQGFMLFVRGGRDYPIFTSTSLTPATNATLRTTGNLNTGVQNIPVNTGFTVIGNPYASTINFNSVFSKAATQAALGGTPLSNSFYLWDPNIASAANVANGTGGWVTLTTDGAGGYIAAPDPTNGAFPHPFDINGDIQSGAAFIVNGTGSGSVQIDESDKVTGSSNNSTVLYRPSSSPVTMLRTTLYATSADSTRQPMYLADGVVNIFGENYSNNVNLTEDVQKQQNLNEKCAISKSNTLLSTERRSPAAGGDSILFNLSGLKKSNYRFDFIASNFNRPDLSAVLIDSATHTVTPVHLGDSTTTLNFSVTADSATFANNRFYILFKSVPKSSVPPVIVDTNKVSSGNGIIIYPNPVVNGTMHLQLNNLPAGNYGLNILSTAGKIVFSKTISYDGDNDVQNINIDKAIANGIYILQVLHPDGSITKINFEKQ